MTLPQFVHELCEREQYSMALDWSETDTERLAVHTRAFRDLDDEDPASEAQRQYHRRQAEQLTHDLAHEHGVTDTAIDGDTITVYCGPHIVGHHTTFGNGGVDIQGHYCYVGLVDGPRVDMYCPDEPTLEDTATTAALGEDPGEAARATYRRTRL